MRILKKSSAAATRVPRNGEAVRGRYSGAWRGRGAPKAHKEASPVAGAGGACRSVRAERGRVGKEELRFYMNEVGWASLW
jgi:hypothetical protein